MTPKSTQQMFGIEKGNGPTTSNTKLIAPYGTVYAIARDHETQKKSRICLHHYDLAFRFAKKAANGAFKIALRSTPKTAWIKSTSNNMTQLDDNKVLNMGMLQQSKMLGEMQSFFGVIVKVSHSAYD